METLTLQIVLTTRFLLRYSFLLFFIPFKTKVLISMLLFSLFNLHLINFKYRTMSILHYYYLHCFVITISFKSLLIFPYFDAKKVNI